MKHFFGLWMLLFFVGLSAAGAEVAPASGVPDPLKRSALKIKHPAQSVLLDVVRAGDRLVAVGERGVVVFSDDEGKNWRQAESVPVSVTLTGVQFPTPQFGWAVGHAGVVLHTTDGGDNWRLQLDGFIASEIALKSARDVIKIEGPEDANAAKYLADAERLVADGPDKPFLDLYFKDEQSGFIIGAYGMIFQTEDGGETWSSWMDRVENPNGYHLYSILELENDLFIAGEVGLFLRCKDGSSRFEPVDMPFEVSFFTMIEDSVGGIIVAGLIGEAYRTPDRGKTFTKAQTSVPISYSASARLMDGTLIFANQAGFLLQSLDNGRSVIPMPLPRLAPVAALLPVKDKMIITAGVKGISLIPLKK